MNKEELTCMNCGFITHCSRDMIEHLGNYLGGERDVSENCTKKIILMGNLKYKPTTDKLKDEVQKE